jgi:hypothetical protein
VSPSRAEETAHRAELAETTVAWSDQWFDPDAGLLWNPPGSFGGALADASVHLIPQSAWYAFGLVDRARTGDVDRAEAVIGALLDHQYDRPGASWHGTFSRFAEWPEPVDGAVEWDHYDPNWRQFVGTALLLILRRAESALSSALVRRVDRCLWLAVEGEPADRVTAAYTNIALMKAVLEAEAGARFDEPAWVERGVALAASVADGPIEEYNSPTYYGIDLLGAAMARSSPADARLRAAGDALERRIWTAASQAYHAGLGNLCGPYTRSYGMDMHRYVAAFALWLWPVLGPDHTPLPDLDAPAIDHGHDLCLGPVVAALAGPIPADAQARFGVFEPKRSETQIAPGRVATMWMDHAVMLGGERSDQGWWAWHQYYPATVHWSAPRGVGSIRLVHAGATSAIAAPQLLEITCGAAAVGRPSDPTFLIEVDGLDPAAIGPHRWELPGLDVTVHTDALLDRVEPFGEAHLVVYRPASLGTATSFSLHVARPGGRVVRLDAEGTVPDDRRTIVASPQLTDLVGIGQVAAANLTTAGIRTVGQLATASIERIQGVPGFGPAKAANAKSAAQALIGAPTDTAPTRHKSPTTPERSEKPNDNKAEKSKKGEGKKKAKKAKKAKKRKGKKRKGKKHK